MMPHQQAIGAALVCALVSGASAQPRASITSDNTGITLNGGFNGDVKVVGGQACTARSPCALGASITSMQSAATAQQGTIAAQQSALTAVNDSLNNLAATAAQAADVAQTYLTQTDAMSTYVAQSTLTGYMTTGDGTALADSARLYTDQQIEMLANLTVNSTEVAAIIQQHRNWGLLHDNGTFYGDLYISGDSDLTNMQPLLDHVVEITGYLYIYSMRRIPSIGSGGFFSNLRTVRGDLRLQSNLGFTTMGDAFPALTNIGGSLWIYSNRNLVNMSSSFGALTTIGGGLRIGNSPSLGSSVGSAFRSLNSIGGGSFGSGFNAATDIYIGDLISYPGSSNSNGDINTVAALLNNKRVVTGNLQIYNQPTSVTALPQGWANQLRVVGGIVYIYNSPGFTSLDGIFPQLVTCGGLYMYNLYNVQSMANAFPQLSVISGSLTFRLLRHRQFTAFTNGFPQLRNVTGTLQFMQNYYVNDITGTFNNLQWVGNYVYMYYNQRLSSLGSQPFPALTYTGGIRFYRNTVGSSGLTSLNNAFPNLRSIGRYGVYIYYEYRLQTVTNSFPQLQTIQGPMYMYYNYVLRDLSGSFPQLRNVTGNMYMYRNYALTTPGNAFAQLTSVGRLYWYAMGSRYNNNAQQTWCNNAATTFCPATTNYQNSGWRFDTDNCCNAFCATSSLC